jgi:hypothetical protein
MTTAARITSLTDRSDNVGAQQSYQQKDTAMKLVRHVQLINEALSRARMRRPQTANSEATRPARQIMMSSRRREQDRLLGL